MAAVIWNRDVHSMANLPKEVLSELLKYVHGKDLISLSGTCTTLKDLIEDSPNLTEKIAFKVSPVNIEPFYDEGIKTLTQMNKRPACLSIHDVTVNEKNAQPLLMGRSDWKQLKMHNCFFDSTKTMVRFLSAIAESLEVVDFDYVLVLKSSCRDQIMSVAFPKLQKFKTTHLQINFMCTTLKELEFRCAYINPGSNPIRTNTIEVLTMTYSDIGFFFKRGSNYRQAPVNIKKVVIRDYGHQNPLSVVASENFQRFLELQTNIEEVIIDTFCHYDTFIKFLSTVMKDMAAVKKLTVRNRHPSKDLFALQVQPNQTITELCLDPPENKTTKKLFRKMIESCPQMKKLTISTFDQAILQNSFEFMKNLETIDARIILLDGVPAVDKLPNLKQVNFIRIKVKNFPELTCMPLTTQKNFALEMLRGPAKVIELGL